VKERIVIDAGWRVVVLALLALALCLFALSIWQYSLTPSGEEGWSASAAYPSIA